MDGPKFNLVEIIFGSMIALLIDIVSAFADLLAGVGGFVIQSLSWLLFTLWFQLKGATASANLVRRFLVPIATQIIPFVPTQIFTFLASVYMENHPEKFGLVTTAVTLGKMDVKKLKDVKETRGTFAAAKEARTMYRTAREEVEGNDEKKGLTKEEHEAQSKRIQEKWGAKKAA
ncbi:MAG: hypothetical protein V1885_02890 [Candidatus Brennerbacteria bacterium]